MSKRQLIVAGNWKMNKTLPEGIELVQAIKSKLSEGHEQVIIGAPFIHLAAIGEELAQQEGIHLAAQNCYFEEKGAFTGEISLPMLTSVGVTHVILGHSERRKYFGETDDTVAKKVKVALRYNVCPILCVGEELSVREAGNHETLVKEQISKAAFSLSEEDFKKVIIAYEPVWAIGTGVTASPEQAQDMHAFIRSTIAEQYDNAIADQTTILYGGSCKPANAQSLFSQPDVDGGLIGGASLKADDFVAIVNSF